MIGISLSTFTPETRETTLQRLTADVGIAKARADKAASGKPYLLTNSGAPHGLAISHIRKAPAPLSLMAVAHTAMLGLDTELWPEASADPAFLKSIASPEDAALMLRLSQTGRDPAIFLWVLKEAALKASGDVMTDPRNVSVEASPNGHFWVSTSRSSASPIFESCVRLWRFFVPDWPQSGLVALAVAGTKASAAQDEDWHITSTGLDLVAFDFTDI